jgi:hypothetical protein
LRPLEVVWKNSEPMRLQSEALTMGIEICGQLTSIRHVESGDVGGTKAGSVCHVAYLRAWLGEKTWKFSPHVILIQMAPVPSRSMASCRRMRES